MADPSSKGKSRITVASAVAGGHFRPAWVENTGGGPCARASSMRQGRRPACHVCMAASL